MRRRRLHSGQERVKGHAARFRACMFGRRWGKNVLGIDEAMTTALNGGKVGWFEPTYKYLLEAWRELENRLRPAVKHISTQEKRIELLTGGVLEAWTCDTADPARGRSYDLAIINEAGIIRGLTAIWQEAIRPTLADRVGRALFLGTPKGRTHDFSVLFTHAQTHEPDWEAFRGPTSENPHIPKEEIAAAKRELPPQVFAQEFEGVPSDDGGNPFGLDAIMECVGAQPVAAPVCWGWDFARAQDWTVGIALDRNWRVAKVERWQLVPWEEQFQRIAQATGRVHAWGDATAMGGDVVLETLQRRGCPMIAVPFTSPMKQQLMERLAVVIQQRRIQIPEGPVRAELESFGYEYTARGVKYTAPDGLHDDCVMALALAVYGRDQVVIYAEESEAFDQDAHPGFTPWGERRMSRTERRYRANQTAGLVEAKDV